MALKNEMILVLVIISSTFLLLTLTISCILLQYSTLSTILLITLSLTWLLRYLSLSILFPGSNKFLKRVFESAFSQDLSIQLIQSLSILQNSLKSLQTPRFSIDHKRFRELYYSIKQNLAVLSQLQLTHKQEIFKQTLKALKTSLKNVKILNSYNKKITLWKVLKNPAQVKKTSKVQAKGDISLAIELCQQGQTLLKTDEKISLFRIFWFDGVILGDLDQQRAHFFARFDVEREFIQVDNERIDTVLLPFSSESVVVYCSPNAGFYEYLFYQSDWLEFYKDLELSVFLFNYRGYSMSTGRPSIPSFVKDCCFFIRHLRENKNYKKVIVHGESLGGSVATLAAKNSEVDLLIADRTFSSTKEVFAAYLKSYFLGSVVTCLGPGNFDIVSNFLSVSCPKILTCDPNDHVIPGRASLLSGISMRSDCSLSDSSITKFYKSLKLIKHYNKQSSAHNKPSRCMIDVNIQTLQYVHLAKDEEEFILQSLLFKFLIISSHIDAAGLKLNELLDLPPEYSRVWLRNLEVWGSQPIVSMKIGAEPKYFAVLKLRSFIKKANKLVAEFSSRNEGIQRILAEIFVVRNTLDELLRVIENRFVGEGCQGEMMVLSCGHSGVYNEVEKLLMRRFVAKGVECGDGLGVFRIM